MDLHSKNLKFDYIYLDPPFRHNQLLFQVLSTLNEYPILNIDGILIIEHESELIMEDCMLSFDKIDERRYGSKTISFFKEFHRR